MFWRKIVFLAAWYLAGNVVASVYKNGKKSKKALRIEDIFSDISSRHSSLFSSLENSYLNLAQKKKLRSYKKHFSSFWKNFLLDAKPYLKKIHESLEKSSKK